METDKWRRLLGRKNVGITHPRPDSTVGISPPFEACPAPSPAASGAENGGRGLGDGLIFNIFNTIALHMAKSEVSVLVRGKP